MKNALLTKTGIETEPSKLDEIQQTLEMIEHKLNSEVAAKQKSIDLQEKEIQRLHALAEELYTTP